LLLLIKPGQLSQYSVRLRARRRGFNSRQGQRRDLSLRYRVMTGSRTHTASYPMGTGGSYPSGKAEGREADHSPPSNAEVKNVWSCTFTPQFAFMAWFTFTLAV